MKLICGLGNPGREYENTRHNMGFLTIDVLAGRLGISVDRLKFRSLLGEGRAGGEKVVLLKPQTYMNLSGEAVRQAFEFYKPDHADLLVIYDDVDLPLGALRIRPGGSSGTHNGMKSVIYQLGFDDFPRARIGLGDHGLIPLDKFVIGRYTESERPFLADAVVKAARAAESFITEDISRVMTEFNGK